MQCIRKSFKIYLQLPIEIRLILSTMCVIPPFSLLCFQMTKFHWYFQCKLILRSRERESTCKNPRTLVQMTTNKKEQRETDGKTDRDEECHSTSAAKNTESRNTGNLMDTFSFPFFLFLKSTIFYSCFNILRPKTCQC